MIEAESAEKALACFDRDPNIDAVLTDHLLSGLTGLDLANAIRAKRPQTPVLLVSRRAGADMNASSLPQLMKPFRHAQLAASVAALLLPSNK